MLRRNDLKSKVDGPTGVPCLYIDLAILHITDSRPPLVRPAWYCAPEALKSTGLFAPSPAASPSLCEDAQTVPEGRAKIAERFFLDHEGSCLE